MTSSNHTRAGRGWQAIAAYGDEFSNLVDLLADAMHWCDQTGQDFHIAFAQACRHSVHELNDEQHDERRMNP